MNREHIIVLTGAGISAESGISTFRDANGLWEQHDVMEVASPQGWQKNPELVLRFYNQRRRQLREVVPNAAHFALVELARHYQLTIITQNVDDLHERAGSTNVLHLHGELRKVRSEKDASYIIPWEDDLHWGDHCPQGGQLRPHIVWFGEVVPNMYPASALLETADRVIIIGTSMQVYPAASLIGYAPAGCPVHYIDPQPSLNWELQQSTRLEVIPEKATIGVRNLVDRLLSQ
ncbi:MAG: NAD-dependent deacylase [Lewinellaceae bacterium]|nr:NAD-dependent deacylase [Lewinellaceae bacterium]